MEPGYLNIEQWHKLMSDGNNNQDSADSISKSSTKKTKPKIADDFAPFKFTGILNLKRENSKCLPIYAIKFNPFILDLFATTIGDRIMVYQCGDRSKKAPTGFVLISAFKADKEDKECLYSLAWSFDPSRDDLPVLAFGGLNGIVRLLSITGMGLSEDQQKNYSQLNGHTGAINDMKFHPTSPFFLVTASQDHTIRLWNVFTKVNIAVLSGEFNRDEVLAIDFNVDGSQIISAGMDRYATIWNINTSEVNKAVDRSMLCNDHDEQPFRTIRIYYSEYCSRKVHSNYIDSIIWFGPNTFLSKSVTNEIVWWAPKPGKKNEEKQNCIILHTFKTFNCDLWFVRMALDYKRKYLALGNSTGDILLWDMDVDSVKHVKRYKLSNPKLENIIRMISFSRCGRIMIACNDEGQLIRYDATG